MSINPYQPPSLESHVIGVKSGSPEDLRAVARYQKGIIVCIFIYLIAVFGQLAIPPQWRWIVAVGMLLLGIAGTMFVFLLAIKVYNTVLGVLLGILTLVPCLGLMVLLIVNGKATRIMRQNGIRVGLFGADPAQLP